MATFRGGCRVGWVNASMPFASLEVSSHALAISGLLGTFAFAPEEVVRVEAVTWFPLLASGVRIVHTRSDVAENVIFWHLTPSRVLDAIGSSGFAPRASEGAMPARRFPFRLGFLAGAFLLWNALGLVDLAGWVPEGLGRTAMTALLCATSIGILWETPMRRLALHDGVSVERVQSLLGLTAAISFVLFVASAVALLI